MRPIATASWLVVDSESGAVAFSPNEFVVRAVQYRRSGTRIGEAAKSPSEEQKWLFPGIVGHLADLTDEDRMISCLNFVGEIRHEVRCSVSDGGQPIVSVEKIAEVRLWLSGKVPGEILHALPLEC